MFWGKHEDVERTSHQSPKMQAQILQQKQVVPLERTRHGNKPHRPRPLVHIHGFPLLCSPGLILLLSCGFPLLDLDRSIGEPRATLYIKPALESDASHNWHPGPWPSLSHEIIVAFSAHVGPQSLPLWALSPGREVVVLGHPGASFSEKNKKNLF